MNKKQNKKKKHLLSQWLCTYKLKLFLHQESSVAVEMCALPCFWSEPTTSHWSCADGAPAGQQSDSGSLKPLSIGTLWQPLIQVTKFLENTNLCFSSFCVVQDRLHWFSDKIQHFQAKSSHCGHDLVCAFWTSLPAPPGYSDKL